MEVKRSKYHDGIDRIEEALQFCEAVEFRYRHFFSLGVYSREMMVVVPDGKRAVVTSKVHKTEHEYCLSVGALIVKTEGKKERTIRAPYVGTTKPGTRRAAVFPITSIWTTTHRLDWITGNEGSTYESLYIALERVEDELIEPYENKLLDGTFKNLIQ